MGRGSQFVILIPALLGGESAMAPAESAEPPRTAASPLLGVRVLVVDDDEDARTVATTALASAGADVTTCSSAAAAYDAVRARPFDALVFDLAMPHMDGYELLDLIRSTEGPGRSTPAVAISAYASEIDLQRSKKAGFTAHVAKPCEFGCLGRCCSERSDDEIRYLDPPSLLTSPTGATAPLE